MTKLKCLSFVLDFISGDQVFANKTSLLFNSIMFLNEKPGRWGVKN